MLNLSRKSLLILNCTLGLGALLLTLGLCEVVLRFAWHNPYRQDSSEYYLWLRVHQSGRDYRIKRDQIDKEYPQVPLRTDERCYVRPSFQYPQPDATIAFLGGSTTECAAVREELRFPALVSTLLEKEGLRVNTLNAARSGTTLNDCVNVLYNHVAADSPDIVVVMEAANDGGVLAHDGDYRSRGAKPLVRRDVMDWLKVNVSRRISLLALCRSALVRGEQPGAMQNRAERLDPEVAKKIPARMYQQRLRVFIEVCRSFQFQPVLMTQAFSGTANSLTPEWAEMGTQDRFNQYIREAGLGNNVPVIDLVRYLQNDIADWHRDGYIFFDGIHVTDEGSRVYAKHIAEQLRPLVQEVIARRRASPPSASAETSSQLPRTLTTVQSPVSAAPITAANGTLIPPQ